MCLERAPYDLGELWCHGRGQSVRAHEGLGELKHVRAFAHDDPLLAPAADVHVQVEQGLAAAANDGRGACARGGLRCAGCRGRRGHRRLG